MATGRPMRADARRNYDRLVTAAREELAERGNEAGIEDIARRAGLGIGTLYRHFPRRIDLIEAVYSTDIDTLVAAADAAVALPDAFEGLETWLRAFVRYAESKRVLLNELHEAFERDPGLRVAIRERLVGAAEKVLDRARSLRRRPAPTGRRHVYVVDGGGGPAGTAAELRARRDPLRPRLRAPLLPLVM
jgi:AcrR family transcriptional regulator